MKKSFTIIYSVIVSLILIFAISFFCVNIYNENGHGELRTQVRFEKMASAVMNALNKNNISEAELTRQINNAIGDTKDFSYIKINDGSKTIYSYPSDFDFSNTNNSKLILDYKKTSGNKNIIAGLYSLRPSTIFYYAKISFFIILIISLLTILLIIYANHFDSSKAVVVKKHSIKKEKDYLIGNPKDNEEEATEEEIFEEETEDNNEQETQDVEEEIVEEPQTNLPEDKPVPETKNAELPTQDYEPVKLEEAVSEKGLFSPDTGFGWESYLMTRLDNELNRATASELDLALFVIKLNGLERTNPVMKTISDYLITEFQFKDLIFEYKNDSICALKISMNIDDAVTFGEKVYEQLKSITSEQNISICIGITTRSIRMVTGERLLKEADEAVIHAMDDKTCPVVGFRADAAKYRKFIESK